MADISKVIQEFLDREAAVGEFIRNGPGEGIQGYARDGYRHRCNELANVPAWARALGGLAFGSASRICQPYWEDQGVDGPVFEPPFTGGQCNNEIYLGTATYEFGPEGSPTTAFIHFRHRGPISGVSVGDGGVGITSRGGTQNTSASPTNPSSCGGAAPAPINNPLIFRLVVANGRNPAVVSITPCGADNCGDPPAERRPGTNPPADPGPLPGPEPTDDPEGGPFPVFPIPPYDDPVGGPTPIEPPPDPTGGGGGAGGTAGGDGLPGEGDAIGGAAGSVDGGEDGEDVEFGSPPDGKVWVGALIECTVDSRLGNIPGTGPQNTVYPTAIANASLKYSIGYSKSQIIRSKWTELVRPVTALVVEGCFIQAQPGVSASVRPISATICPDNPCEEETDG